MFLGRAWQECKADNLTAICDRVVRKLWDPRRITPLYSCYKDGFACRMVSSAMLRRVALVITDVSEDVGGAKFL
jgi:hypothetical protein